MNPQNRSRAWFRLAAAYFVVGVVLGVGMGASGDHSLMPVHAHLNLLGWVSMALFGVIGALHPSIHEGRLAAAQFWLHNLALPVLLVALALRLRGVAAAEPWIGVASVLVGASVLLFAWGVFARLGTAVRPQRAP